MMRDEPLIFSDAPGEREGSLVVRLEGPLTLGNLFEIQTAVRTMRPEALILDMAECSYMDSAGLGLLMNLYVSAQNGGRKFAVAAANYRVAALLETTHVDRVLSIFPTVETAEAELLPNAPPTRWSLP